jgi:uncharacterized protein
VNTVFVEAWSRALREFRLGLGSVHGPAHWFRVHRIGIFLGMESKADAVVVSAFAAFHDMCRMNDGFDPEHGRRAAERVKSLSRELRICDAAQARALAQACEGHSAGRTTDDPTIGTCWDADRLDLLRLGRIPHARFLSTAVAKSSEAQEYARVLQTAGPSLVCGQAKQVGQLHG